MAEAAHAAGYGAKPLPQFYSLSQAGRAIAAARASANWVLRGHGLRVTTDATTPLLETTGEPIGGGADSFSGVARALGSPLLHGRAALGELWAANPDLLQPLTESPWRSATVCVLGTDVTAALVRMRADVARELPAITRLYLTPVSPTAD
ncbi:MAG: hypothetical protein QOD76_1824 [Solirubrobacteraceae bacterium]|nr:hypothetical protein [Solirubrobacteraceae bacterium]